MLRDCVTKRLMSLPYVVQSLAGNKCAVASVLITLLCAGSSSAAQSITPAPPSQSAQPQSQSQPQSQPQITKSPEGKQEEAARAAVRASARHFDRVLIIVLENVDYEVASKDKSLADLAAGGG